MSDPQKQPDAEVAAARQRLEIAALCKLYGATGMSAAAFAKLRDAPRTRIKMRDAAVPLAAAATRDAATALYEPVPQGGWRPRFRPELSDRDLPASIEQQESALISVGYGYDEPTADDWQGQAGEESDIAAIRRLNRAHAQRYAAWGEGAWGEGDAPNLTGPARAYYANTAQGHEPGNPPVAGPNARRYGVTGEGTFPNDYLSAGGVDPVAETRSPPPPKTDPNAAYLRAVSYFADEPQPLSSGPAQRIGAERDLPGQRPNRSPFIAAAYPSGPSPQVTEQASGYVVNFAAQAAARNRAEDEARGLRALNRLHRRYYARLGA